MMKRVLALLMSLAMVFGACAGPAGDLGTEDAQEAATGVTASAQTASDEEPSVNEKPDLVILGQDDTDYSRAVKNKKNADAESTTSSLIAAQKIPKISEKDYTVMVYIVGSNLESHYGAATNDINEMIASGLDYSKNNLIVYTGGSKRWTSDISNKYNSVINMASGEELEVMAATSETADMGAAQTLSEFINYCTANFPAKHYGLVLWDHGAGPLWGYGSDELFDNDSLLFDELRSAMDQTIFTGGKKLDWVGFDACLMGSVETMSLWKDYAQYLIGSEELEPGRGWDYNFLTTLNETDDARTIAGAIVKSYGDYYEANKSDVFNPDVTLAAMDLSKTDALIESIDVLFGAMNKGIEEGYYAELNKARARTKAFGLGAASSKEEAYDLLDLRDLAGNLGEMYPEECGKVLEVLDEMLVGYTANVKDAGGVSIYLPGDNFELYGISKELYSEESALSAGYKGFVEAYMNSWKDSIDTDWTLPAPESGNGELTLQLTEDQVKNGSLFMYSILQRNGFGDYAVATAHIAVEPDENNVLHIPADPMLLHAASDMEEFPVPLTAIQTEDNGAECIYRTVGLLATRGSEFMDADYEKDEEIVITASNAPGEREATVLDIVSASASSWAGGKTSVDVSNYESIANAGAISYSPRRDSEGHMLPFYRWQYTGHEIYGISLEQGFRIEMKPASEFDKIFICQVTVKDINGNVHGSDFTELELEYKHYYEAVDTEKGILYADVTGEEAVITNYTGDDEEIIVPEEIAGKKVTEIGKYAFNQARSCQKIVLPDGLKVIGIGAFGGLDISEIEIPESVEEIRRGAFSRTNLTSVTLPAGLAFIGTIPFCDCEELTEIRISESNPNYKTPDGVLYTKDGRTLIQYPCARSGEYSIADGTEVISYGAFAESVIGEVTLPESVKKIENLAFFECRNLVSFNLPDAIESIGCNAFGEYGLFGFETYNPVIESVHIGPNVRYIGSDAFSMMNIAAFEVDENNQYFASSGGFITNIAKDSIQEVPMGMQPVMVIPDGITTLENHLLEACTGITDIMIPDSVFRFGTEVFPYTFGEPDENGNKAHVISLKMHCSEGSAAEKYAKQYGAEYDNVTDPGNLVFETVTEELAVPEGGTALATWHLFKDHAELWDLEMTQDGALEIPDTFRDVPVTAVCCDEENYSYMPITRLLIPASVRTVDLRFLNRLDYCTEYAVDEKNENYKSADGVLFDVKGETLIAYPHEKADPEYEIPAKTEMIGESAFKDNRLITKVTFPKSLRIIGKEAFYGCSSLTTVEFNKGLKEIGEWGFNCKSLANVSLPSSLVSIGSFAFNLNENFGRIELPEKLETIGFSAFSTGLEETFTQDVIRIPARLKINDGERFTNGVLFERFEVDEASENYTAVDGLLMSKDGTMLVSVPTLKEGDLIVPEGTLYIDYSALKDCDLITDIYLPDSVLDIGSIDEKDYDTGEYKYVIHCAEGSEAQKILDTQGVPWVAE